MKKRISALFLALALMLSLAACGGGGGVAGTYKLTEMNIEGVNMDLTKLASTFGMEVNITLDLKADGSFILDGNGLSGLDNISGTWTSSGSTLSLDADGETITGTLNGGAIVLEEDGQSMTFRK